MKVMVFLTFNNNIMKNIILILSIVFATSCSSDDDNNSSMEPTPIIFSEIGRGGLFGNGSEGIIQSNLVITNTTDWQNLMTQMNSVNNVTNQFSETNIDFNSYTLIAIFLEVKPQGWEVEISNIIENTSNIVVSKTETVADVSIIIQPFHIVKIPLTTKPIEFEE
jgi:hypothetical protein